MNFIKWVLVFILAAPFNSFTKDFVPDSFRVNFVQSFKSSITGKIKKTEGVLEYRYPGNFKFEVVAPEKSVYISNSKTSWYYTPPFLEGEEGEVVINSNGGPFIPEFFDGLKHGLISNKLFEVNKNNDHVLLKFSKSFAKKMTKKEAKLFFSTPTPKDITSLLSMDLVGSDGNIVSLNFAGLDPSPKLSADYFNFTIPPKTKVTR